MRSGKNRVVQGCAALVVSIVWPGCSAESDGVPSETPAADTAVAVDDVGAADGGDAAETPVTWNTQIGPLMERECAACHQEGGAGQFDLTTYVSASRFAPASLAAMQQGRMPPWPPDDACRTYQHARRVGADDLAAMEAWVAAGTPIGDGEPLVFTPTVVDGLRADLSAAMTEPYTPDDTLTDDYRCFVLELEFDEDTWVEGTTVVPGTSQVHHVLLFAVRGDGLERSLRAAEEEDGPGYVCFGGPTPSGATGGAGGMLDASGGLPVQIGAWVPGIGAQPLPGDAAMRVEAGSRIVMQVHYNTIGGPVETDRTSVVLQTRDTPPSLVWRTIPVAQTSLDIRANDPNSVQSITITHRGPEPTTVVAATAHMHTLGRRIEAHVTRAESEDREADECVLSIPRWDFEWQMQYYFHEDEPVVIHPGDTLTLECEYDNSAANQPIIDGEPIAPRNVTWGEGTYDEMCLMYLGVVRPWEADAAPQGEGVCAPAAECFAACDEPTASCLLACPEVTTGCISCAVQGLLRCGGAACAPQLLQVRPCLTQCGVSEFVFGGSFGACMQAECGERWEAVTACLDPFPGQESCGAPLTACGL